MEKEFKTLDLFAGCGGLSKGFENAGFEVIAANDNWKLAAETYVANHPNTKFFLGDITPDYRHSLTILFSRAAKAQY